MVIHDKHLIIIDESNELLWQALNGMPYLIIVQQGKDTKGSAIGRCTNDFDFDNLFASIKCLAKKNKRLREKLADYIIDLSKEI